LDLSVTAYLAVNANALPLPAHLSRMRQSYYWMSQPVRLITKAAKKFSKDLRT
jgi:hypothetical protein